LEEDLYQVQKTQQRCDDLNYYFEYLTALN